MTIIYSRSKASTSKSSDGLPLIDWLPVMACILIAIVIRLYRTSPDHFYLLAGSDGPYFPIQVRYLIEQHRLAFPDMPLLFIIGAFFSSILYLLHIGSLHECILLSVRLIDAFLPPLAAIPVFLIARELTNPYTKPNFTSYVMVAYAILNFTPLVHFSFQLQKNGAAVVLVFLYMYFVVRILKYQHKSDSIKAIIVLLVCALTHFGSCGLLLFSSFLIFIGWLFLDTYQRRFSVARKIIFVAVPFSLVLGLIALFDMERFVRLVQLPLKLFEAPVLLFTLHGQNLILHQPLALILILTNLLAIQSIILLVRNRSCIDTYKVVLGLSFACCAIFLSNPFLGLEWAKRLFMLAYIPLTILYLIVFSFMSGRWLKGFTVFVFISLLAISFLLALFQQPVISISKEAFAEFDQLDHTIRFNTDDAVVSSQDLRILANWSFTCKGVSDYLLTKDEFARFRSVYFIQQVNGRNPLLRRQPKPIPDHYKKVFIGNYFEVYQISSPEGLPAEPEKIFKGIRGIIVEHAGNELQVKDYKTGFVRKVYIKDAQQNPVSLYKGMKVEINGEFIPFSLAIQAETIKTVQSFD